MSPDTVTGEPVEPESETPAGPAPDDYPDIVGFIDAVGGTRVGGWAWNRQAPEQRLDVEILLDGAPAATVRADRTREDLVRGGVGDGAYGFEHRLTEPLARQECHRVGAQVTLPGLDGPIRLKNLSAVNAGDLALSASDFTGLVEQIDQCITDQRAGFRWLYRELQQLTDAVKSGEIGARGDAGPVISETPSETVAALRDIDAQITALAQEQLAIGEALGEIAEAGRTRDRRMGEIEVFNARLDAVLAEVRTLRQDPAPAGDTHGLKRLVIALGVLTAASLAAGIAALVG